MDYIAFGVPGVVCPKGAEDIAPTRRATVLELGANLLKKWLP